MAYEVSAEALVPQGSPRQIASLVFNFSWYLMRIFTLHQFLSAGLISVPELGNKLDTVLGMLLRRSAVWGLGLAPLLPYFRYI